jgi:hypothetical protein
MLDRAFVQRAHQQLGLGPIIASQCAVDVLGQRPSLRRHQVAADPFPDRFKRDAREPADALVVGPLVDEEGLERREEQPRGVADAGHGLPGGADSPAQFLQHEFVASGFVTTEHAALQLGHQHCARLGLEREQIVPQPFDGLAVAGHCHTSPDGAGIPLGAGRLRSGYAKGQEFKVIAIIAAKHDQLTVDQLPSGLRQAVPRSICGWVSM